LTLSPTAIAFNAASSASCRAEGVGAGLGAVPGGVAAAGLAAPSRAGGAEAGGVGLVPVSGGLGNRIGAGTAAEELRPEAHAVASTKGKMAKQWNRMAGVYSPAHATAA
jgi:hypothetical protein